MDEGISPRRLLVRLTVYFLALIGGCGALIVYSPTTLQWLPLGGNDAIEVARIDFEALLGSANPQLDGALQQPDPAQRQRLLVVVYLAVSLLLTILVMLPITWTYVATRFETGFRKSFVHALIVLPICATTIVMLIQDSLALAFGLAALVTAVRFRVALTDPIDGIYIFAAVCVSLAAGVGYLGIAAVMAIFFCYAATLLWARGYGRNPLDEAPVQHGLATL